MIFLTLFHQLVRELEAASILLQRSPLSGCELSADSWGKGILENLKASWMCCSRTGDAADSNQRIT